MYLQNLNISYASSFRFKHRGIHPMPLLRCRMFFRLWRS